MGEPAEELTGLKRKREAEKRSLTRRELHVLAGRDDVADKPGGKAGQKLSKETRQLMKKYRRGQAVATTQIADRKLRGQLKEREKVVAEAVLTAAEAEKWLLPSTAGFIEAEGVESTRNFQQAEIVQHVGEATKHTAFDLHLPQLGPYSVAFSHNGRSLLLGGRKGHLAMIDWRRSRVVTELQVKETVRDVCFLHNEMFFAAAQKKYVYIYDKRGLELHCLKDHSDVLRLQFLRRHFLLASINKNGLLSYTDTSTGHHLCQFRTRKGRSSAMAANPYNGVINLGQSNGTVALWSPNSATPLATFLAHRGPVTALDVDHSGRFLVSGGIDGMVKVWDLRTYNFLHGYFCPTAAKSISVSQRGLLAVGQRSGVEVWADALEKKQSSAYLRHRVPHGSEVEELFFCPYEDILGVGHAEGFTNMLVPGAGEPNFDTFVANPFETAKQRREAEVHALLEKLPPESIVLDPEKIGTVWKERKEELEKIREQEDDSNERAMGKKFGKERRKTKGRNASSKRHMRKQTNVIDEKRQRAMDEQKRKEREEKEQQKDGGLLEVVEDKQALPLALTRFKSKK